MHHDVPAAGLTVKGGMRCWGPHLGCGAFRDVRLNKPHRTLGVQRVWWALQGLLMAVCLLSTTLQPRTCSAFDAGDGSLKP